MSFMMVMFPFWMCMGSVIAGRDESSVEDIVMECALLLPVSVVYFSILLHPIRLSKMHYLCPMTRQERLDYVKRSYVFRIVVHMIFFLCGLAVLLSVSYFHVGSVLLLVLNDLMLSMLVPPDEQDENGWVYMIVLTPCYLVLNLSQLVVLSDAENHWIAQAVSYAVFLLLELPVFLGYRGRIKRQLAAAADYEKGAGETCR
jgi:hypothetical protein